VLEWGKRVTASADLSQVWSWARARNSAHLGRDGDLVSARLRSADRNDFLRKPQLH